MFKLALVQMFVEGGARTPNLQRAEERIAESVENGADIVLLPEAMDLGWAHPSARTDAQSIPGGETCARLIEAATKHGVHVCSGLVERDGDDVYNSAVIISPNGEILLRHRKLNELEIGHAYYAQGDRLGVCRTEFGTLGLMICADGFAEGQVLSRSLCYMGADVILSPSAWAVPADHDNDREPYGKLWRDVYKPVAKDFSTYIASVSNVGPISAGPWEGRKCIGCSLVIGPHGDEVMEGPYGIGAETILYVNMSPVTRPARACAWPRLWKQKRQ
jgi:predicted amidohydrolase